MPEERTYESVMYELLAYPERHMHIDHFALEACCFVGGALDIRLIDAHSDHIDMGTNGGKRCDVVSGPCACGAWH